MKAIQLIHKTLYRSLQSNRSFSFAKLAKETEVDDDVIKYTNAKEYYDYLLRFTPSDERGYVKFREGQFSKMVNIANSAEDISAIRDAFYNFIGHKLKLSNTQVDNYLQKAIELKSGITVHEILANHNFLKYFPHTDVLRALAQQHVQENNSEAIAELATIYANGYFLKIDAATLAIIANFAASQNNDAILYQVARAAAKKNIVQLSEETISQVLGGLARRRLAGGNEPKEGEAKKGDPNKVEVKFLELIAKIPQTYKTTLAKAYLALSHKNIDSALVELANFHQVDIKKLPNPNVEVISNTPLTLEFLDKLQEAITASNKPKYAERLAKVTSDIAIKLGKTAVNQEVIAKIEKIVAESSKQSVKEEQPKQAEPENKAESEVPPQAAQ